MNKVILLGRLTRDPEVKYTNGEKPLCIARFGVAVNRKFKTNGQYEADFPSCVAMGKTGEFVEKYFHKGDLIAIEGRLQTGSYEKDGVKVYTTDVMCESVEFAQSKSDNAAASNEPKKSGSDFVDVPEGVEEELPFA